MVLKGEGFEDPEGSSGYWKTILDCYNYIKSFCHMEHSEKGFENFIFCITYNGAQKHE